MNAYICRMKDGLDDCEDSEDVIKRGSVGIPDKTDGHYIRSVCQGTSHPHRTTTALLQYINTPALCTKRRPTSEITHNNSRTWIQIQSQILNGIATKIE